MKYWSFFLVMILNCLHHQTCAQISGIINQYTPVTVVSCNQVDVLDASFLSVGDRVLIIQMKGATINTTNSVNFGTITNYNDCGNYEFATVTAINGSSVTFQYQLLKTYTVAGRVQLIRVPQYTNISVDNTLTAQNWDGSTGGVLVMEVSGTLTLNAPISVNEKGFRGSFSSFNPDGGCGNHQDYFYPVSSGFGALKGEGIAEVNNMMNGGRGALGNGGGGGNKHNTGGGGGSNGTKGGRGGDQATFCGQQPIGGEGGMALDYTTGRLFMGGGGGSPDYNDGMGSPGANGGGIVIIRAATIQSNNNMFIESSGGSVVTISNGIGDGAGGGGAGGVIALDVTTFSGNLILRVDGGDGGNIQTTYPACFGPGGGGGTGAIQYSGSIFPAANVVTSFMPGNTGITTFAGSSCALQPYGATSGELGQVYSFNRPFPEGNTVSGTFDLGEDIEVCEQSLILTTDVLADSYLWSTGETSGSAHATVSGQYWLSVSLNGCWLTDTVLVTLNSLTVDAGPDQTICMGESITLHASSLTANATLVWNNGLIDDQPFTPQGTTIYTVTATSSNGNCTTTDSVLVTVNPLPVVSVTPSDTIGCVPLTVSFTYTNTDCASADWTFSDGTAISGCGNQSVTFNTPGCYDLTLKVTSPEGCIDSSDFTSIVCVSASPTASFLPVPSILDAENPTTTMVNNSVGGDFYEWNFGDNTVLSTLFEPAHSYSPVIFGSYPIRLTVTNEDGCSDTAYGSIYMEGGSVYYVPNTFTPDGNEFNQVFRPVFEWGIDPSEYNLKVFNRWGEIVFESNDPAVGWDGTYHDELAPEGVYTWRIEYGSLWSSEHEVVHGHVNLLK